MYVCMYLCLCVFVRKTHACNFMGCKADVIFL